MLNFVVDVSILELKFSQIGFVCFPYRFKSLLLVTILDFVKLIFLLFDLIYEICQILSASYFAHISDCLICKFADLGKFYALLSQVEHARSKFKL